MINTIKLEAYYLRYNEIKIWKYVAQCEDVKIINEVFMLDLEMKLNKANKKNQSSKKSVKWYRILINLFQNNQELK